MLEEASGEAATERLGDLCRAIGGGIPVRRRTVARRLAAGAVRCAAGQVTERLVARAEQALARAADCDPAVLVVELDEAEEAEHLLVADLRRAVRADALHLAYQPKLCARGGGDALGDAPADEHPGRGAAVGLPERGAG